jgi:hypothetical protein
MTLYKDLPPAQQQELTQDMLRVNRELGEHVTSTFEKLTRLVIAANAGGMLLTSGLVGAMYLPGLNLRGFVIAGALFASGFCSAGGTVLAMYRRLSKMSAQTTVDLELVHANKMTMEKSSERLNERTRRAGFANLVYGMNVAAALLFVCGIFVTFWAVSSLEHS